MFKRKLFLLFYLLFILGLFMGSCCGIVTPVAVTGVNLDPVTMTLTAGGATGTLVATLAPANATNKSVTWSSSAPAVATVANGVVTPLTKGTTTIKVTTVDGDLTATCTVTVSAPLSAVATITAGTLAGVALAGTFTGGADIASSSALTVTVPDASKTNAALALTKGNANSVVKYVKGAQPANDTAYTETYLSGSTPITVANADVIWLLATAEDGTTKKYYKVTVTVLVVGQSYGEGIVAYIDGTGVHGLIAAAVDQNGGAGMAWSNITSTLVGNTGTAIGTGQANTTAIVGQASCNSGAAYLCDHLVEGGYSDWYLPSRDELNQMYVNLKAHGVGGFANAAYWSSSETSATNAWNQNFNNGNKNNNNKNNSRRVRAVRSF